MSWIKPNFLWMMFRSGWAAKESQEHILAVKLRRTFFDEVLEAAVASTFSVSFKSREEWQLAIANSNVRLQWDPDHDPHGACVTRRAVQLGLRGEMLRRYGTEAILGIEDITPFVNEQRAHLQNELSNLRTPTVRAYQPSTEAARQSVRIDS